LRGGFDRNGTYPNLPGADSMRREAAAAAASGAREGGNVPPDRLDAKLANESATASPERTPDRLPPAWGAPLTEADYATLATSWITQELADQAQLLRVDAVQGREVLCQKGTRDCAGILISYYWPGEPRPFNYRVRRDNPEYSWGKDGKPKPERKYLGPPKGRRGANGGPWLVRLAAAAFPPDWHLPVERQRAFM